MKNLVITSLTIIFLVCSCMDTGYIGTDEEDEGDITSPVVNITYPHDGQTFYRYDTIDIKVDATDNIGVKQVGFSIQSSGYNIGWTDYTAPYIYEKWVVPDSVNPGYSANFKIRVTASDTSMNFSSDEIDIIVPLPH